MTSALIIVDLQKDFSAIIDDTYLQNLKQIVDNARTLRHHIIWIFSEYANDGSPYVPWENMDEMCNRTHTGKAQYCKKGTPGKEFIAEVAELIDEKVDTKIKKTFYSAFTGTRLENVLRKHRVEKVYIGGVTSTTCVKATTYNACKLNFNVTACRDIIYAFSKGPRHEAALKEYETFGAQVATNPEVIQKSRTFGHGAKLHPDVIPTDVLDLDFDRLKKEIGWCEMISHGAPVPRLVCCQGTIDPSAPNMIPLYRHPVDAQPVVDPWTPSVKRIRDFLSAKLGHNINHALIQLYRDGTDYIGEHSDKTLDICPNTPIMNFTVGATRNMLVREKIPGADAEFVPLHHNSLFEFDLVTNEKTRHEIRQNKRPQCEFTPEEKRCGGARISFTFRCIGSFLDISTGRISGQGARKDGDFTKDDYMELRAAFSEENRTREFDWEKHYGQGFNAIYVTEALSRDFVSTRVKPEHLFTSEELAAAGEDAMKTKPVLHFVSGSVPSWKVEALLNEKGIEYEKKREKVMVKLSDKLASINWRQLTPTLIDVDGTIVRESWAVLQYINAYIDDAPTSVAAKNASLGKRIFPEPTRENKALYARVHEICHAADDLLKKRFGPIEEVLIKKMSMITDEEFAPMAALMAKFEEELQFWETEVLNPEKRLANQFGVFYGAGCVAPPPPSACAGGDVSTATPTTYPYVVGDHFTIADIAVFTNLGFIVRRGLPLHKYSNVRHYYESMAKRPCFVAGAPETWNLEKPSGPNIFVRYESRRFGKSGAWLTKRNAAVLAQKQREADAKQEEVVVVTKPAVVHEDHVDPSCDWVLDGEEEDEEEN